MSAGGPPGPGRPRQLVADPERHLAAARLPAVGPAGTRAYLEPGLRAHLRCAKLRRGGAPNAG